MLRYFRHVEGALNEFKPDIIIYNAGTDILDGDPLGCLSISPQVGFLNISSRLQETAVQAVVGSIGSVV